MTRTVRRLLILLILAACAGAGIWYLTRPTPVAVALHTVARGKVEETVANTRAGSVKACRRARLAPATGGQVTTLTVHEGDRVESGQLLLELWNEDLRAQLKLAESEALASQSSAEQACLVAEVAQRDANRQLQLKERKLVSDERVDQAVTDARAKGAACRAAQASARVSTDKIAAARAALDRTMLKAPFAGVVGQVNGELGEYVTPSPPGIPTPPAVDLIDDSCLYISAPMDEVDVPGIRVGMPACVTLDAFPGKRCQARVKRIAPFVLDIEKQARTVDVEVDFSDAGDSRGMLPGYSADIEVVLKSRGNVLRIPTEALLEGNKVLVFQPLADDTTRGLLEERPIKTGISNWEQTEVVSGLSAGERIVTSVDRAGVKAGALAVAEPPDKSAQHGA